MQPQLVTGSCSVWYDGFMGPFSSNGVRSRRYRQWRVMFIDFLFPEVEEYEVTIERNLFSNLYIAHPLCIKIEWNFLKNLFFALLWDCQDEIREFPKDIKQTITELR